MSCLALLAVLTLLPEPAAPPANERSCVIVSPNARYRLRIDPSSPQLEGSARVALEEYGLTLWSRTLAFTPWSCALTDDGRIAGFSYVVRPPSNECCLSIFLLDQRGELVREELHPRESYSKDGSRVLPTAIEVLADVRVEHFVVLVEVPFTPGTRESWWTYDLRTGVALSRNDLELHVEFRDSWPEWQPLGSTPCWATLRIVDRSHCMSRWCEELWIVSPEGETLFHEGDGLGSARTPPALHCFDAVDRDGRSHTRLEVEWLGCYRRAQYEIARGADGRWRVTPTSCR